MVILVLVTFLDLFVLIFSVLLILRVILSYLVGPENALYDLLLALTDPVLSPVRRALPQSPGIDFAPLIVFFGLQLLQRVVHGALGI